MILCNYKFYKTIHIIQIHTSHVICIAAADLHTVSGARGASGTPGAVLRSATSDALPTWYQEILLAVKYTVNQCLNE